MANRCSAIWGLNKEGELNGTWRDLGVPGLWYMMGKFHFNVQVLMMILYLCALGNLALCRFHSKHVALRK